MAGVLVWVLPAPPVHGAELDRLIDRIVGGTSLLRAHRPSSSTRALHEAALRFRQSVYSRTGTSRKHYAELTGALRNVRTSYGFSPDREGEFILTHLQQDMRALDGRLVSTFEPAPPSSRAYSYGFIRKETCLGGNAAGKRPCPSQPNVLTFRLPRGAARITNVVGEWRDYGLKGKILVHIDGVQVWRTDVKRTWDRDRKFLDHPVPSGATISLRSENGDPIWIRRFEVSYARH